MPQVEQNLTKILKEINDGNISMIYSSAKSDNEFRNNFSNRRSQYIGVSKNGQNWQVLINMGNCKKYIGTYETQKQAALAYDFYSIAIHFTKAKTNFDYNKDLLSQMAEEFLGSDKRFEPSKYVDRV